MSKIADDEVEIRHYKKEEDEADSEILKDESEIRYLESDIAEQKNKRDRAIKKEKEYEDALIKDKEEEERKKKEEDKKN